MRFKKIKLSAHSEPIDNPNYIDCQTPEEAVAIQFAIEMLNIQYDMTVFRDVDEKMKVRYFTDTNLKDSDRQEIEKLKNEAYKLLPIQMGDGYYKSVLYVQSQIEAADKKYKELGL